MNLLDVKVPGVKVLGVSQDETFDTTAAHRLDDDVALRPEPFGALAYHYGSRRLTFLRSKLLADLVEHLGDHPSVDSALESRVSAADRDAYRGALESLFNSRFIRAV
jgi:mycofactocin biosynthesis protein MftB